MDTAAQRAAMTRATWPRLTARAGWLSLIVTVLAVAALIVYALPHGNRAAEPETSTSGDEALNADSTAARISAVAEAAQRGDLSAAHEEWYAAYRLLRPTRDWHGMAALGDAAMNVAGASGSRQPWEGDARQAYLGALFRARAEQSLDGILRATEAFATLGDREVVAEGLRIADSVAARTATPGARELVGSYRARLGGGTLPSDAGGPMRSIGWDAGP